MSIKALLVDDEISILNQAEIFLERISEEIETHTVSSADEALDMMDEKEFNVVVSDYQMPEKDGLKFLEELREERENDIPFIMFTGKGREDVAIKALNLGADRYLQKGGDPKAQYEVLVDAIKQENSRHCAIDELEDKRERLKFLELATDTTEDLKIAVVDENYRYKAVNRWYGEQYDLEKNELIGMTVSELMDEETFEEDIKPRLDKAFDGEEVEYSSWYEFSSGQKYLNVKYNPIKDKEEVQSVAVIGRDLTDRKEMEEKLRESEKRYRRLAENINDIITLVDQEGKIIYANQRAHREVLGYDAKDMIGKKAFEFFHPDDRDKTMKLFEDFLDSEDEKGSIEIRLGCKDGAYKWVESSGRLLPDGRVLIVSRDITDRKEAEERIEESKKKIERLHEISAEMQTCQSEEEVYSFAVEAAEEILKFNVCVIGSPKEDGIKEVVTSSESSEEISLAFKPIEDSVYGTTVLQNRPFLIKDIENREDVISTTDQFKSGISVPIGDHSVFQVLSIEKYIFDKEDLKMGELLVSHVSQALNRIKIKDREEFLHSLLRHDVGNKVKVASGYLDLMEDSDSLEEIENHREKTKKAVMDALYMIEKIRKLRMLEKEGDIDLIDLDSVVDKVLSKHKERLQEKNINVDVDECDYKVNGGVLLEELFYNLIENSIEHSDCDEIKISSQTKEDECLVTVEDNGTGISDEVKEKIFERGFKKGESAGTGLGLYMAKEIAETYGGSVEVSDSKMDGARFDVKLRKSERKVGQS